jgi:hypothetical protein
MDEDKLGSARYPPGIKLGGPSASGVPLRRDRSGFDSIGNSSYRVNQASLRLFLTFGGWSDNSNTQGNADYLRAAFSELAAAMDPGLEWTEFEALVNRPIMWVEQPTMPTVYAEAEWCGKYLIVDDRFGHSDTPPHSFPPDPDPQDPNVDNPDRQAIRRLLALTFYIFFPLMDFPGQGQEETRAFDLGAMRREGQWEAATVFFAGSAPSDPNDPSTFEFQEPPLAVALSRDPFLSVDFSTCRPWSQVTQDNLHPRLYVSRGRHHLLFAPPTDQVGNYDGPGGGAAEDTRLDATDPGQEDFPGSEGLLIAAALLANPWLLLAWLISVLLGHHNDANNGADGPPVDVSAPAGDGAGSIATPSGIATPGQVLSDGRRVDDPATTLLRFINQLEPDPPETAWPDDDDPGAPPPPFEHPYWWQFAGRWGVAIPDGSLTWSSGTRRVDRFGRSLGYLNTVSVVKAWAQGLVNRPP